MDVVAAETASYGAFLVPLGGGLPHVPISQSLMQPFEPYVSDGWNQRDARYKAVPTIIAKGIAMSSSINQKDRRTLTRNQCGHRRPIAGLAQ